MICVAIKDSSYNELKFYFETLNKAGDLISLSLREGYKVTITAAEAEKEE